jgi:hypothetical protein
MFRRALALGASAALLAGCANHVRDSTDSFERSVREVVNADTIVDARAPVLTSPRVEPSCSRTRP